ncbi:MAG: ABC transporter permease [Phycisphaerae bacterium]
MNQSVDNPLAAVTVTQEGDGGTVVALSGRLARETLPGVWSKAVDGVRASAAKRIVVDASGVAYCDGSGLGLFAELRRLAAQRGGAAEIVGLAPDLQRLVGMASLADPTAAELTPPRPPGFVANIGRATAGVLADLRDIIGFTGELAVVLLWAIAHPRRIRGREFLLICEKAGVNALPVICLLGSLVGLIMAFQTAVPLQRYGAITVIPSIVSIAMVRELSPLITAIILAGRSGSAFAAEIGTMRVTQEIDALQTLGLDPLKFLAIPRVLAGVLMTPLLTMFSIVTGVAAGYIVMASYGYSVQFYVNAVMRAVGYADLIGGVAKTLVLGLIVAAIGCLMGLRTAKGPSAVGDSTTRAVVAGIVLIVVADMIFGLVYFSLGI